MTAALSLDKVCKSYGTVPVVHDVDLTIESGEFTVFVGPSGCGKSTLLRMIAGLESITGGTLSIDGDRMNEVPSSKRGIAMVFQSYALYPHMSVYKNISFGLETAGMAKAEIAARVRKAADVLQIEPLLPRKPKALSGGQRQRVAIGRAIVREPRVFLFDEPLSNLDAELRVQMRVELAKLHADLGTTMIYVTHDQVEAMTLADKIVVLRAGRIEQVGRPLDLYNHPVNKFVAGFIGSPKMNFFRTSAIRSDAAGLTLNLAGNPVVVTPRADVPAEVTLGVRPEHILIGDDIEKQGGIELGQVTTYLVEHLGHATLVYARLPDGQALILSFDGQRFIERNATLRVGTIVANCHVFGPDDQAIV
jgi:multiple sugar transport system ATP-binding protein